VNFPGDRQPKVPRPIPAELEPIARDIVDAAFKVHTTLGPGLLESVYEVCLSHELRNKKRNVERQLELPILYDSIRVDGGLRIDFLVDESVIVEVKAIETIAPVHKAQILTYLKLSNKRLGFLINFNVPVIKNGIYRLVL
jgi:GxxExxY protein